MKRTVPAAMLAVLVSGCASEPPAPPQPAPTVLNVRSAQDIEQADAIVRTSRYVMDSAVPARQVRDTLSTEININIPSVGKASVSDGLAFVLSQTGYTLRAPLSYGESQLYQQPLPLVHMNMGYMSVRQALQVMGGTPWVLEEDVVTRQIGFRLREGYVWQDPLAPQVIYEEADAFTPPSMAADTLTASISPLSFAANDNIAPQLFVVPPGKSYQQALQQWVQDNEVDNVAWHLDTGTTEALSAPQPNGQTLQARTLEQAIHELSTLTGKPLQLVHSDGIAAIHSLPGLVDVIWVNGDSLKGAVASVVRAFEWKWQDSNWLALDDYAFLTPYPIVSPKGDIAHALEQVLTGYPIQAQLMYGTTQAFFQEKE